MVAELTSTDLDKFLNEKALAPAVSPEVVNQPPQNGLQQATSLVSQGNNGLQGITELLKVANELVKNGSDLFGFKSKNLESKEQRLNLGQAPTSKYSEFIPNKPIETPKTFAPKSMELGNNHKAERVFKWFELMLETAPEDFTIKNLKEQWIGKKRETIKIITNVISEQKCIQSNANTVDKSQNLETEARQKDISTSKKADHILDAPKTIKNPTSGKKTKRSNNAKNKI